MENGRARRVTALRPPQNKIYASIPGLYPHTAAHWRFLRDLGHYLYLSLGIDGMVVSGDDGSPCMCVHSSMIRAIHKILYIYGSFTGEEAGSHGISYGGTRGEVNGIFKFRFLVV